MILSYLDCMILCKCGTPKCDDPRQCAKVRCYKMPMHQSAMMWHAKVLWYTQMRQIACSVLGKSTVTKHLLHSTLRLNSSLVYMYYLIMGKCFFLRIIWLMKIKDPFYNCLLILTDGNCRGSEGGGEGCSPASWPSAVSGRYSVVCSRLFILSLLLYQGP